MEHRQYIFNDISKKSYNKCKQLEKEYADAIFSDMCYATSNTKTFKLQKGLSGANIMKALMVRHMPYTRIDARWYEVEKHADGTKSLIITTKHFKKYMKRNVAVKQKIGDIVVELKITDEMDKHLVATKLAEYVATHCEYDDEDKHGYDAYACLIVGCTICCGFSEGFKALADYCNIPCQCIGGSGHEWNRVKIKGRWYNVDTTWLHCTPNDKTRLMTTDKVFYSNHMPMEEKEPIWKYSEK